MIKRSKELTKIRETIFNKQTNKQKRQKLETK